MANKETQEALNYMFGCAVTKDGITDYEEKRMIECSDIIKKAIDRNELLEKALDKACEELANADKLLHQYTKGKYIGKEEWKEYLYYDNETCEKLCKNGNCQGIKYGEYYDAECWLCKKLVKECGDVIKIIESEKENGK